MSQAARETVIRPTGTCFDDALDLIEAWVRNEPHRVVHGTLRLVHGICLAPDGPKRGTPFAHAWVEELVSGGATQIWQSGLLDGQRIAYSMELDEFEAKLRVQKCTRYTLPEAVRENHRTNHYGPWLPEYAELCGSEVFES